MYAWMMACFYFHSREKKPIDRYCMSGRHDTAIESQLHSVYMLLNERTKGRERVQQRERACASDEEATDNSQLQRGRKGGREDVKGRESEREKRGTKVHVWGRKKEKLTTTRGREKGHYLQQQQDQWNAKFIWIHLDSRENKQRRNSKSQGKEGKHNHLRDRQREREREERRRRPKCMCVNTLYDESNPPHDEEKANSNNNNNNKERE